MKGTREQRRRGEAGSADAKMRHHSFPMREMWLTSYSAAATVDSGSPSSRGSPCSHERLDLHDHVLHLQQLSPY